MGKRKTKSGKQKQTKKKGNSSILGKNGNIHGISSGNISKNIRIACSLPKPASNKKYHQLQSQQHTQSVNKNKNYNNNNATTPTNEKEDFDRQMNSMVERSKAAFFVKRRSNKRRNRNPVEALMTMKPASFSLVKSTNQLMEETTHQMGQIMSHTNNNNNHNIHNRNSNAGSSLARAAAAIAPSERTPTISNVQYRTAFSSGSTSKITGIAGIGNKNNTRNSFSALENCSSDEEDEQELCELLPQTKPSTTTIRFAPAAFSVGKSISSSSSSNSSSNSSLLLPTKTPPTTPSSSHHHHLRAPGSRRATSLFGTINEEEVEELHYQQQTGKTSDGGESESRHTNYIPLPQIQNMQQQQQQQQQHNNEVDDDL